jgi:hypothetical protein
MPRQLPNFIDGFASYMADKGSPALYVKWSAIFAISAALERKAWITTAKGVLYANQYIILVGGAGIGKSVCTKSVYELLETVRKGGGVFHIAPTSVTKASLIDALNEAERTVIRPMAQKTITSFNSLTVIPNEFGVFLPSWEGDFMSTLTDLWDCGRYAETRRTRSINIEIPNTQLNLFSATTPAHLTNLLPEGAWEQGFMSRVLLVFSGEIIHTNIFTEMLHDEVLWAKLVHDIRDVYNLFGEFTVTEEAQEALNMWARSGGAPMPDHPKLVSYCSRRIAHVLKLCIVASAATDDSQIITLDNFAEALDWLVELETYMVDIFKSMKAGGDARAMEDCWHFAFQHWMKKKEPVPEHLIYAFLQERSPAHSIDRIIDVMCRAQILTKQYTTSGGVGYVPKGKAA